MIAVLSQLGLQNSRFFLKISKAIGKAGVRVLRARSSRASPACKALILSVFKLSVFSLDYVNVFPRPNFVSFK